VGLTGNIATGKSAVMGLAQERGAYTIDTDQIVRKILATDSDVQIAIAAAFGPSVRRVDGRIKRRTLGSIVFNDPSALRRLELIIHPVVRRMLYNQVDVNNSRVVLIEAIKLLEGGLAADCDQIWVTRCSESTQMQRLMICRGMDEATARQRIDSQSPQEIKVSAADVVINTDGTMVETERHFNHAWNRIINQLPPKRSFITELNKRENNKGQRLKPAEKEGEAVSQLIIRRARPADVPSILWLIKQATNAEVAMTRSELLAAFGDRGYIIGQQGTTISAVAGWIADYQVATVEEFYIYPREAAAVTGEAVLEEIESTAESLLCEVILACRPQNETKEIRLLFEEKDFVIADPSRLPKVWKTAISNSGSTPRSLWMKVLQTSRKVDGRQGEK
jgi:dephospho-CoA kinase